MSTWSNQALVVYKRTYARKDSGKLENWNSTVERVIRGNIRKHSVSETELNKLEYFLRNRKASPAGRGLWFSGAPSHEELGGAALNNCYYLNGDRWENLAIAQDLLMLGGGVGMSVEHRYVSKLKEVKAVTITHIPSKDAHFIVPDSREGWCHLLYRVLEAYLVTGRSFTYSTVCIRGAGEPIKRFGGTASGPLALVVMVEKICKLMEYRVGKHIRPIDMADILCCIAEMVVSGNVRRSALMILGDAFDREFLRAKRWDLDTIPSQRSNANFSVVVEDFEDLTPAFWKTYEMGEPFGLFNRKNARKYARMGELKPDNCEGLNPCAEAVLVSGEPCNLFENALHNMKDEAEFEEGARLGLRWAKRITCEKYHHAITESIVKKNRRVGIGITGCLMSPLFVPSILDRVYEAIQDEDRKYSKELGIPESIRTTVVKPSGTISKVMDARGYEGIHAAYSQYMIQRIRFSASDPIVRLLKQAGHHIVPVIKLDGKVDWGTLVVDFYQSAPEGYPVADRDWGILKQLEILKMAQKHWADQAVSVTVYFKKEDIQSIKEWLSSNLQELKTISFLCHSEHGFKQAPKEAITREQYEKLSAKIKPIDLDQLDAQGNIDSQECANGACPIK
jgi:ribonucleoside-triphosphate reductase